MYAPMREPTAEIRQMAPTTVGASPTVGMRARLLRRVGPDWLRTYAIATGVGVLLAFTGANNSGSLSLLARLFYWLILMIGGTLIAQAVDAWLDRRLRLALWQEVAVMTLAITPPITLLVWLVSAAFGGTAPDPRWLPHDIPPVLLISACMSILHATVNYVPLQSHVHPAGIVPDRVADAETTVVPGETFRARLEFKYRQAEILALSAEDHYLRVHSSAGETLILMRLYDAIRELDGIEGSQTHRSWWVAKDAITEVKRRDGRVTLELKNGVSAPVSRSFTKALKGDGWL